MDGFDHNPWVAPDAPAPLNGDIFGGGKEIAESTTNAESTTKEGSSKKENLAGKIRRFCMRKNKGKGKVTMTESAKDTITGTRYALRAPRAPPTRQTRSSASVKHHPAAPSSPLTPPPRSPIVVGSSPLTAICVTPAVKTSPTVAQVSPIVVACPIIASPIVASPVVALPIGTSPVAAPPSTPTPPRATRPVTPMTPMTAAIEAAVDASGMYASPVVERSPVVGSSPVAERSPVLGSSPVPAVSSPVTLLAWSPVVPVRHEEHSWYFLHKGCFLPALVRPSRLALLKTRYLCVSLALFTEDPNLETFNNLYRDTTALFDDITIGTEMRLEEFGDWLMRVQKLNVKRFPMLPFYRLPVREYHKRFEGALIAWMENDTISNRAKLVEATPGFFTRICHGLEQPWYCTMSLFQGDPNHVQEEGELLVEEQALVDRGILVYAVNDNINSFGHVV